MFPTLTIGCPQTMISLVVFETLSRTTKESMTQKMCVEL